MAFAASNLEKLRCTTQGLAEIAIGVARVNTRGRFLLLGFGAGLRWWGLLRGHKAYVLLQLGVEGRCIVRLVCFVGEIFL